MRLLSFAFTLLGGKQYNLVENDKQVIDFQFRFNCRHPTSCVVKLIMPDNLSKVSLNGLTSLSDEEKSELGLEFTPSEILQQPDTWKKTFHIFKERESAIRSFLHASGLTGESNGNVIVSLIGAGTSDYIGRSLLGLLRMKWRCHVVVNPSTDLLTETDAFMSSSPDTSRHIWISFSRSGESFEGVRILEYAYERHPAVRHIIVTCNAESRMANDLSKGLDNVLCVVLSDEVNDRGLAMTGSFTNMVVAGQCLANIDDLNTFRSVVETLSSIAHNSLGSIAQLAQELTGRRFERICFLGSGPLKAVADESALKVLELSGGFHSTMAESFLGLRHGPLSWLDQDSLVVGFVSNNTDKSKIELGLLEELRRKHAAGCIVAITPDGLEGLDSYCDHHIPVPASKALDDYYLPPLYVIFAQVFGLFSSLSLGLKPDSPSADGKIQRVVSEIRVVA